VPVSAVLTGIPLPIFEPNMPILARQVDVYPDDLLDEFWSSNGYGRTWWAVYTMARREKSLMRRLHCFGIPFYSPLIARKNRAADGRVRVSHVPLFSGYVFLYSTPEQRLRALSSNCISRMLEVPDPAELVRELQQIKQMITSGAPLSPEARLQPGMPVRVRSGPLQGLEGVVIERRGRQRLLVAVEFLQQGASVSLDDYLVERID